MYDIIKATESFPPKRYQWGRMYYAQDSMGLYVPVLFNPYFDWRFCFDKVEGGPRKGKWIDTPWSVIKRGIMEVWHDRKRILKGDRFCDPNNPS